MQSQSFLPSTAANTMSNEHAEPRHSLYIEMTPINTAKESMNGLESNFEDATLFHMAKEKEGDFARTPADPNVIDWDEPNDSANPLNWTKSVRIGHVALISLITLIACVFRHFWLQP